MADQLWDDSALIKACFVVFCSFSSLYHYVYRCLWWKAFETAVKSHKTQHQAAAAGEDEEEDDIGATNAFEDDEVEFPVVPLQPTESTVPAVHHAPSNSAPQDTVPNAALLWPPPPAPTSAAVVSNEALQDLLAAWYWSGFYAGRLSVQPK